MTLTDSSIDLAGADCGVHSRAIDRALGLPSIGGGNNLFTIGLTFHPVLTGS